MDHQLEPQTTGDLPAARTPEIEKSHEDLQRSRRLVVYGSWGSGSIDLVHEINGELKEKGVEGVDVYASKDVANLENAFYGRGRQPGSFQEAGNTGNSANPALEAGPDALPQSTGSRRIVELKGLGGELARSAAVQVEPLANATDAPAVEEPADTIPYGVMVFPTMRHYDQYSGAGMTVETPTKEIEALCEEHGVPLVYVQKVASRGELEQPLDSLIQQSAELPPAS